MALPWVGEAALQPLRGSSTAGAARRFAGDQIEQFDIRTAGPEARTGTLSGGNLQKALLAREIAREPRPARGAADPRHRRRRDREFIHASSWRSARAGGAVLLISEDLEEIFALSDRIAVMYRGRIMADLPVAEARSSASGS